MKEIIYNQYNIDENELTDIVKRSKLVVENSKGELLFVKTIDNMFLIGGHVENNESDLITLIREIKEEVGLDVIDFKLNASSYYEKSNTLICNFIVRATNENYSLTTEVDAANWFTIEKSKEAIYKGSLAEKFYNLAIEKIQSCYN